MEIGGVEPLTFCLRSRRATNCAISPNIKERFESLDFNRSLFVLSLYLFCLIVIKLFGLIFRLVGDVHPKLSEYVFVNA